MLEISHVNYTYRNFRNSRKIFDNFSLKIEKGEFISLFGPNGSGKTTLLNLIAGVINPGEGNILFNGKPIKEAKIAYVFQDYRASLFPWLTAYKNITFPLDIAKVPERQKKLRLKLLKDIFGVKLNLNLYPYELSGGQQQLVSIMRGLIINPDILLLDEPFSSLDYRTSLFLLKELEKVWLRSKVTTVFVSHNIDEVIFLSQKILIFKDKNLGVTKTFSDKLPYPRSFDYLSNKYAIDLRRRIMRMFSKGGEHLN